MWYNSIMKIDNVSFQGFRNLETQQIDLAPTLNVFCGDNAQGKTNLIESIYLCSLGRSPRTDNDKELVNWSCDNAVVRCNFSRKFGQLNVEVNLSKNKSKKLLLNGNLLPKVSQLLGNLNTVYFSPQEIKIVNQSPADRRHFLDVDLCQLDKNYFFALSRFKKALTQRNNLLKSESENLQDEVGVWDEQIAQEGATLILKRKEFCQQLKPFAQAVQSKISQGEELLNLHYLCCVEGDSHEQIATAYKKMLKDNFQSDVERGYTQNGCQRDDILLFVNGKDVKKYGSQGQQRTAALALKIAETQLFEQRTGESPILLLDDVLSELDSKRQKALLEFSNQLQIVLTACFLNKESLPKSTKIFKVEKGNVTIQEIL